ncbi:MAG TPA: glycosyltransferase [Gemmatimonadaceae bacterium]|nr:glycosyltransferase [Gemmatimonadaceae bacterium]
MRAAYVGTLTPGSTSRMRAEWLRRLTPGWKWEWLDTDALVLGTSRMSQSLAYRVQRGPAVTAINDAVRTWFTDRSFDLTWVDKGVFLAPPAVSAMRRKSRRMIHYTPDTAFFANKSRYFTETVSQYDVVVTTKSFEAGLYAERGALKSLFVTTQGYDPEIHFPRRENSQRTKCVAFVGLAEPSREILIAALVENGIDVRLAGAGWETLVRRLRASPQFTFEGRSLFGEAYATLYSECWVGLGLLSKRFPELHTTRTFEIPACGAVLATERNEETVKFFSDGEALFFRNAVDLAERLTKEFEREDSAGLEQIAARGRARVITDARDYPAVLSRVLQDPRARP